LPRYRVEFSPAATAHVERIHDWWRANRPKAPGLFRRELTVALRHLRRSPHLAPAYEGPEVPATRRLLMPRTRYHVYFAIDDTAAVVRVYAVWHASRGQAPR
jgi:plasmid stabilization system protein ParE